MDERLQLALARVNALHQELADALAEGDDAAAERLVAELSIVERRRNRLVHRSLEDVPAYSGSMSMRDQVIRTLRLLGRPASARLISDVSKARWGEPIPTKRLSSLRRDEQTSWAAKPGARAAYVTAAITGDRFAPVRGVLALSSWPLEVRILGPASQRVDLLLNLINLAGELTGQASAAPWMPALEQLVLRLARTVPTALEMERTGDMLDADHIRRACHLELGALDTADRAERSAAADRAAKQLRIDQQLFGVRLHVIAGDAAQGESG